MSIEFQRLEIEHVRRVLLDWLNRQPDRRVRLTRAMDDGYRAVLDAHGVSTDEWLDRLEHDPVVSGLHHLLIERAFGNRDAGSRPLLKRFLNGPGGTQNGLRRRYLRRLAGSTPQVWRVVGLGPGARLDIAPSDGGDVVSVHHRHLVEHLATTDSLLASVIDMPAGAVLGEGWIHLRGQAEPGHNSPAGRLHGLWSCVARSRAASADVAPSERDAAGSRNPPGGPSGGSGTSAGASGEAAPETVAPGKDRERLLERVRKLFAMAQESEASPHEAEIALRRCQSLMAKYGITEADLETSAFANAELDTGSTVPMHLKYLGSAVARLHDVLFVTGSGGFAEFRGYEVDANVARLTLRYLLDEVERALKVRKRQGNFPAGRSAAYDYRVGFAVEVSRRVSALVTERDEQQRQAAGSTGTALATRKREIVERECGQDLRSSSFRERGARDAAARAAGHDDGSRVSLDTQVEGSAPPRALPSR